MIFLSVNPIRWLTIFFFCILLIICQTGCGNSEPEESVRQPTAGKQTPETSLDEPVPSVPEPVDVSAPQAGDDLGEPCSGHRYVVEAGSSASFDFHVLMNREVYLLEAYANMKFDLEDVSVKTNTDDWTKLGVLHDEPSIGLAEVDTLTELWGVRAEDLVQKHAEQPGKLISIARSLAGRTSFKIKMTQEGFGLFEKLGNWWPEQKIATMSEDQVYEALGNKMEVEHIDQKFGTFKLPVEMIPVDSRSYILTVTYTITFPESLRSDFKGTGLWQGVMIGERSDTKFVLKFDYDKKRGLFFVQGPWFGSQCF